MLFSNGNGTFGEFTDDMPRNLSDLYTSGVIHGDYDQNGFSDILIVTEHVPAQHGRPIAPGDPVLYRNEGNSNNWITLRLRGTTSNRTAVGARVTVEASGLVQTKEIYAGSSHLSTQSPWLTFGLASNTQVDAVTVRWPGGELEAFITIPINTFTLIVEGAGTVGNEDPGASSQTPTLHSNIPNPFTGTTLLSYTLPRAEYVRLAVYDLLGREVSVLVDEAMPAGRHGVPFIYNGLPSGIYLYRLEAGSTTQTRRMLHVQ
jgi:hypothetical protein